MGVFAPPVSAMSRPEVRQDTCAPREECRLLVNALKLAACSAERTLALRFDKCYQRPQDPFSVFRGLLHLPGVVRATDSECIEVRLHMPDGGPFLTFPLVDLNQIAPPPGPLL